MDQRRLPRTLVDLELRGCPIDGRQLLEVVGALLAGRKPNFQKFRMQAKKELEKYVDGCDKDLNAPPSMRRKKK